MSKLYILTIEKLRAFKDASGATAIEYALIAAGIAVAIIVSVGLLGEEVSNVFETVTNALEAS